MLAPRASTRRGRLSAQPDAALASAPTSWLRQVGATLQPRTRSQRGAPPQPLRPPPAPAQSLAGPSLDFLRRARSVRRRRRNLDPLRQSRSRVHLSPKRPPPIEALSPSSRATPLLSGRARARRRGSARRPSFRRERLVYRLLHPLLSARRLILKVSLDRSGGSRKEEAPTRGGTGGQ